MKIRLAGCIYIFLLLLMLFSCIPQKKIIYFQGAQPQSLPDSLRYFTNQDYEFIIGPNDVLSIQIDGIDDKSFDVFKPTSSGAGVGGAGALGVGGGSAAYLRGTLVNKYGEIEMPFAGKIKLSGLSLMQAGDTIRTKLGIYMADPSLVNVTVKIMNFNVTVIGEVSSPGIYQPNNEFMTITELLAKAGDLTIYSNRKNIKLIRSDRETKQTTVYQIDLTKAELINPIIARLQPNDVIYVEPLSRKRLSTASPVIGIVTSVISFALLAINLYSRL